MGELKRALESHQRAQHRTSRGFKIHPEMKSLRIFIGTDHEDENASSQFVMNPHKDCDTPHGEIEVLSAEEPDLAHFENSLHRQF